LPDLALVSQTAVRDIAGALASVFYVEFAARKRSLAATQLELPKQPKKTAWADPMTKSIAVGT
jgi:hypothetical protein